MGRGGLIRRLAREALGEEWAKRLWGRVEFIGDIAVIRVPFGVDPLALRPLAQRLLDEVKYVKSVWAGLPGVRGSYRLRDFVHLAGEPRSETVYKEHGCLFKLDITKVYVSPVLGYEHMRVARLVRDGEVVTNMFAGAGLFSIIMAKHARPRKVYSIDINPDAYRYMVENARLNRVEGVVEPILGDAAKVIEERLAGTSDRVLMPYPELALDYLPHALRALREGGGVIHVYLHVFEAPGEDALAKAEAELSSRLRAMGVGSFRVEFKRAVRMVGPRRYQVVLDVRVGGC